MAAIPSQGIRPVWLASYPRSGNTFLRIVLETFFRLPTYSLYYQEGQDFHDPSADPLEQAPRLPRDWRSRVSESPEATLTLIKTHDLPENDSARVIYIVRDGRAAIDSYFHYHKKFSFEQPSLTAVLAGACQFGSWSEHYRGWQPRTRPNTLFLRYEDLVASPDETVPQLARFLGVQPTDGRLPTFEELKARSPAFFRRGQNKDYATEWTGWQMALFNQLHGDVMEEMGYPLMPVSESAAGAVVELARTAARSHKLYLEQLSVLGQAHAARQQELKKLSQEKQELVTALADQSKILLQLSQGAWVRLGEALGLVKKRK